MSKTISPVRPSALEHELAKTRTIEVPKTAALKPDAIAHPGATATPDLRSAAHTVAKPATSPLGPDVSGVPYASDINASAHKYGLPPTLLAGLIAEESTFRPGVVSSKGAIGLTQLEPSTAKSVGVTDPYDPAQNIAGGAKYLKGLIDAYHGNIPTALAAYNAGSGNVAKAGGVPPSYTLGYIANIDNYAKGFAHGANVPLTMLPSTASGTATAPVETPAPVHEPAFTATGSSAGLMQQGASGNAVRVLQDQLGVTADGAFGPKTKAAVEQFQKAHKLEADGVVGPQTRAALAASRPELSQGATGTNVRAIQQAVGATVDGQFGPKTKAAVENFQRAHGLQADGVVGPKTWAAIEGASAATSRTRPTAPATPVKPPVTTPVSPASPTTPSGSTSAIGLKTLHIAQSQHTHEGTGNNDDDGDGKIHAYQSTTGAYNAPWCASFVSWCEQQSGGSSHRSAAVGSWVSAARQNQDNLHTTNLAHVKPGDLVAFSWDGNPNFDDGNEHIGIVQSVTANSVTFVSGNWKNSTATATLPLNDDGTRSGSKALVQFIGVGN